MITPLFKPLGASTHLLAKKWGALHQVKATHTGTLDPMAEGVVIVLSDQDRFDKQKYSDFKKTYVVKLLQGVATDSEDLLGLITNVHFSDSDIRPQLAEVADQMVGTHTQIVHPFSSKRIDGDSFFNLSKKGVQPPMIAEQVELFSVKVLNREVTSSDQYCRTIIKRINSVQGDFRQKQIVEGWEQLFANHSQQLSLISLRIVCSKRTYVRSLVRYLSEKIGHPLTVSELIRTHNGPYSIADCICLI